MFRIHNSLLFLLAGIGLMFAPGTALAQHYHGGHYHGGHHHDYHSHYHYDYYHRHYHPWYYDSSYYRPYAYPLSLSYSYRSYYHAVPPVETVVAGNRSRVEVRVPVADGEILVDGAKTTSLGLNRSFETPKLKPGKSYSYRITASWKQGGEVVKDERTVQVKAGRTSLVDFTRPAAPEPLAAPKEPMQ